MQTFIKTQAALIAGSVADFLVTFLLVNHFNCWYIAGTLGGNITGAAAQFVLSRNWVFNTCGKRVRDQLIKFILMWLGNIALSVAGVYALTNFVHLHYLVSKLIVSVVLGVSYTYLVSKKFVFI